SRCQVGDLAIEVADPPLETLDRAVVLVELEDLLPRLLGPGDHLVDGRTVPSLQGGQSGTTLLDSGQRGRVEVDVGRVPGELGGDVGDVDRGAGDPLAELRQTRIVPGHRVDQRTRGGERG